MAGSTFASNILESVAATNFGQFVIKRIDAVLALLVQPAKYCVDGECKDRKLWWPVFWTVLIYMQTLRVVFSTIFNKSSIESKDIVSALQRWRRRLRAVRFRGLRKTRESKFGKEKANGNGVSSGPSPLQSSKKRHHNELSEDDDEVNLLDELMSRTFTDSDDDSDPTFVIGKGGQDNESSSMSKTDSRLQDTLPIASASEHHESSLDQSTSNDITFVSTVSTVDDTEVSPFATTEDDSTTSHNEEVRMNPDSDEKPSTEPSTAETNGTAKIGKESLNVPTVPSDPVDAMMSKFVEMERNGKLNLKKNGKGQHGNKKKRNHSLTTSQENVNRQKPIKESKSQEAIDQL